MSQMISTEMIKDDLITDNEVMNQFENQIYNQTNKQITGRHRHKIDSTFEINYTNDYNSKDAQSSINKVQVMVTPKRSTAVDSAWSWVVLAVCMLGTTIMGSSYILFSLLYRDLVDEFETSSAAVGWVGSIYAGCANLTGIPVGLAIDKFGCRAVCICGSLLCSLGCFLSFFASHVTFLYITYGLLSGTGLGMIVTTCNVNSMRYFEKKRALAGGVVSLGYSMGAIFMGPIMRYLFEMYSWRGILVIFAGFTLQMTVASAYAFKPLPNHLCTHISSPPRDQNGPDLLQIDKNEGEKVPTTAVDSPKETFRRLLSDPLVVSFLLSCSFMYTGAQSYIHHNPSRALLLGVQKNDVNYLPMAFDATSGVMKVVSGVISNNMSKIGRIIMYTVAVLGVGLCHVIIHFFTTLPLIMLHGVITGFFTGFTFCLYITIMVDLKGLVNVTKTQPMIAFCFGVIGLICTPFAGFLYDVTDNYDITFLVTGVLVVVGSLWSLVTAVMFAGCCRNTTAQRV